VPHRGTGHKSAKEYVQAGRHDACGVPHHGNMAHFQVVGTVTRPNVSFATHLIPMAWN
jgi:hypothetical protein